MARKGTCDDALFLLSGDFNITASKSVPSTRAPAPSLIYDIVADYINHSYPVPTYKSGATWHPLKGCDEEGLSAIDNFFATSQALQLIADVQARCDLTI